MIVQDYYCFRFNMNFVIHPIETPPPPSKCSHRVHIGRGAGGGGVFFLQVPKARSWTWLGVPGLLCMILQLGFGKLKYKFGGKAAVLPASLQYRLQGCIIAFSAEVSPAALKYRLQR